MYTFRVTLLGVAGIALCLFTGCNNAARDLAVADGQEGAQQEYSSLLDSVAPKCTQSKRELADTIINARQANPKLTVKELLVA